MIIYTDIFKIDLYKKNIIVLLNWVDNFVVEGWVNKYGCFILSFLFRSFPWSTISDTHCSRRLLKQYGKGDTPEDMSFRLLLSILFSNYGIQSNYDCSRLKHFTLDAFTPDCPLTSFLCKRLFAFPHSDVGYAVYVLCCDMSCYYA